jgi:hypothetical protein
MRQDAENLRSTFVPKRAKWCQLAGFPNLLFRDLRGTATRKMMQSGFSRQTVMEAAGVKTASLLWHCTTTEKEDIIAAGRLMQRYLTNSAY